MTALEYYLVAVFAAVWLIPLGLSVRWEIRRRKLTRQLVRSEKGIRS
jgi:hypothetical protein